MTDRPAFTANVAALQADHTRYAHPARAKPPTVTLCSIDVPRRMLLTLNQRQHYHEKARITKALRGLGREAERAGYLFAMPAAHCVVAVGWPDRRVRDSHNIYPTIKALIDGIVTDGGLLPGDDDRYLLGPDLRPYLTGRPGVVALDFTFTQILPKAWAA